MSNLILHSFEGNEIRTGADQDGQPVWIAMDVCRAIGLSDVSKALSRLDGDDTKSFRVVDAGGREREVAAVNESGLYTLFLRSSKPEAKRFKNWVTREVLPSIRKTGSYSTNLSPLKSIPEASQVFLQLVPVAERFGFAGNQASLSAAKATRHVTGVDLPQLLGAQHLIAEVQIRHFTPTELGARMNISARKFNELLLGRGLQVKRGEAWSPTDAGKTFSVLLDTGKKHSNGTPVQQLKWIESVLEELKEASA